MAYGYSGFDPNMSQKNDLKNGQRNLQAPLREYVAVIASVFIFNVLWSADVIAAPEEIQAYLDDFAEVGKSGLDLHTNYVASGQQSTDHQFRVTSEFSYGVNTHWEVGHTG